MGKLNRTTLLAIVGMCLVGSAGVLVGYQRSAGDDPVAETEKQVQLAPRMPKAALPSPAESD